MLIKYITNHLGDRVGVVVATITKPETEFEPAQWNIGWSQCHKLDKFDKKLAKTIAITRAKSNKVGDTAECAVPNKVIKELEKMYNRANIYFKRGKPVNETFSSIEFVHTAYEFPEF